MKIKATKVRTHKEYEWRDITSSDNDGSWELSLDNYVAQVCHYSRVDLWDGYVEEDGKLIEEFTGLKTFEEAASKCEDYMEDKISERKEEQENSKKKIEEFHKKFQEVKDKHPERFEPVGV